MTAENSTKTGSWRRRLFRRFRQGVALLALALITLFVHLNLVGVPASVRARIEAELHARGLAARLGRVHLRGWREVVARDIRLGQAGETNGPHLLVNEAGLRFDPEALRQFRIQLTGVELRQGHLVWPLPDGDGPGRPASLDLEDIQTELNFLPDDRWELEHFSSRFLGTQLSVAGTIRNASALSTPRKPPATTGPAATNLLARFDRWAAQLRRVQLPPSSLLSLHVTGDARDAANLRADLRVQTATARTPWGRLDQLNLTVGLAPGGAPDTMEARVALALGDLETADRQWHFRDGRIQASGRFMLTNQTLLAARLQGQVARAETRWAQASNLTVTTVTTRPATNLAEAPLQTTLSLSAENANSRFVRARFNHLDAEVGHALTNFTAIEGRWRLAVRELFTDWVQTESVRFTGRVSSPNLTAPGPGDVSWGPWDLVDTLDFDWECEVGQARSTAVEVESLYLNGRWRPPHVHLTRLHSALYGSELELSADLDVARRELNAQAKIEVDARRIAGLIPPAGRRWLEQIEWESPPRFSATTRLILPPWTNAAPDWRGEVIPTVRLDSRFDSGPVSFQKVGVSGLSGGVQFSDGLWRLSDFRLARPEGDLTLESTFHAASRRFNASFASRIDPTFIKPALEGPALRAANMIQFTGPPLLRGTVEGTWPHPEEISACAFVHATNFTARGQHCDEIVGTAAYTNLFILFTDLSARRGDQRLAAPSLGYDLRERVLHLTNGVGNMDPEPFTRVIGPKTYAAIEPYRFARPPRVRASGVIPTDDTEKANIRFEVEGEEFSYWRFRVPRLSGDVIWRGDTLAITNVQADFYNGRLKWEGRFDFTVPVGTDFGFKADVTDLDLRPFLSDLMPHTRTNRIEGRVNGTLAITYANSDDPDSWQGHGEARMRDGFLWNIPLFGVLTPTVNRIMPGFAESKVSAATGTFTVIDTVVHTKDFEVQSPALRLQYDGQIDLEGRVDARMQAEILRDAWVVGRAVSIALWPLAKVFEYKVTGTLGEPKLESLYIPKFFLMPFQPIKTLKELFQEPDPTPPTKPDGKR